MKNALEPKRTNKLLIPAIALALAALGVSFWLVVGRSNSSASSTATDNAAQNNAKNAESKRGISALGRLEPQGEVIKVARHRH